MQTERARRQREKQFKKKKQERSGGNEDLATNLATNSA